MGVLLIGMPPLILAGAWRMAGVSALEDDLLYYFPHRAFVGQSVRHGQLPLWSPGISLGYPLAADPQAGLWYPFTYLFAALPATLAYPVTICLHFSLAGGGVYRFVRATGHRRWAAIFAAVAFEFAGFLVAHRAHLTIHHAAAWVGWILFAWHRFAVTGRARHFALAAALGGLQLLVQHVQVSLITGAIVVAYMICIHSRRQLRLLWQLPAGIVLSLMLAGIQLVPTFLFFARSTRGRPLYELFVENSFEPISAVMWVFPMIFGCRTPNFYDQPWWGPSHLCEQAAYASIAVLAMAGASLALWRRDRQIRFWSILALVCVLLALGSHNPLMPLLFQIPLVNSLRVPARWLLGFSLALPILGACLLDHLRRDPPSRDRASAALRAAALVFLPALTAFWLIMMAIARTVRTRFEPPGPEAIAQALHLANPAVWIPLVLVGLSSLVLWRLARRPAGGWRAVLVTLLLVDFASFAAFVDVDRRTYASAGVMARQPLAEWINEHQSRDAGRRLWVPRIGPDYHRPLAVLWPATNLLYGVPTMHGYGPLMPLEKRALLRLQPWGSAESAVSLLRNPRLLAALGVRWIAARSDEERELLLAAGQGDDDGRLRPLAGRQGSAQTVRAGHDLTWPVGLDSSGVYAFEFCAVPKADATEQRWYARLETPDFQALATVHYFEPADLAIGERRFRCYFIRRESARAAQLRVACFHGEPVAIADPRFGRVGDLAAANDVMTHEYEAPGGVRVYQMLDAQPRFRFAQGIIKADSLAEAVQLSLFEAGSIGMPAVAVVEGIPVAASDLPDGTITIVSERLVEVQLEVQVPGNGYLVFADSYDPGWQATIDGRRVPVFRTNAVLQGINIPAGGHQVVFRFRPVGMESGTISSVLAIAALGGVLVASRRPAGRPSAPSRPVRRDSRRRPRDVH